MLKKPHWEVGKWWPNTCKSLHAHLQLLSLAAQQKIHTKGLVLIRAAGCDPRFSWLSWRKHRTKTGEKNSTLPLWPSCETFPSWSRKWCLFAFSILPGHTPRSVTKQKTKGNYTKFYMLGTNDAAFVCSPMQPKVRVITLAWFVDTGYSQL